METNIVYNQDCIEGIKTIPDNSIDLILTDPPYLISRKSNFDKGGCWNDAENKNNQKTPPKTDFGDWDKCTLDIGSLISEWYRILKPSGTLIVFYDIWKMSELKQAAENSKFKQLRLCRWDKTNPVPINSKLNYLTNSSEYFMTAVKGSKPVFNSEYDKGIYTYPICGGSERTPHPTQKPLALISDLVVKHSNPQDLVLDCFIGSGTTAAACIKNNRRYIGYENNPEYFRIAVNRCSEAKNKKR